jgi:hypothetical protein
MSVVVSLDAGQHLQENQCKCPNFRVFSTGNPLPEVKLFSFSITSVFVDASDDEGDFFGAQKWWPLFLLLELVGEGDEIDITDDCDDASKLGLLVNTQTWVKLDQHTTPSMIKI